MDRLSPLDATFLYVEDGTIHMHIASCALFEGPVPTYQELLDAYAAKLRWLPRYRQVVRFVPLQLGRPVWVDAEHFDLEYHVRQVVLPKPGGDDELRELMGHLMSQELDRRYPLWEAWLVNGLADGRWALVSKVHHCMADGIAGNDLMSTLLDPEPDTPRPEPDAWHPRRQPSGLRLVGDALTQLARSPYEQARAIRRLTRTPGRTLANLRAIGEGAVSEVARLLPTRATSLSGGIGPRRRWTWTSLDVDDVKTIRRAFGGTFNDVVVSVVTGGLRDRLLAHEEPLETLTLRALIPVSVRTDAQRGIPDNRVSGMLAELPIAVSDPVERLAAVRRHMDQLKSAHHVEATLALENVSALAPPPGVALAERAVLEVVRRIPRYGVNTVVTNVPGPQRALYLAGREMLEYRPYVPIATGARIGVAIMSYNGKLTFGVTGDEETAPDVELVARGIEKDAAALLRRAARATSSQPDGRARTRPRRRPAPAKAAAAR
jgi:diacylglycerol O-acyltransferase